MIFYFRHVNYKGQLLCKSGHYIAREFFLRDLQRANKISTKSKFEEVPNSCVRKLFGSCDWTGTKGWPK
jgi:hypothetical protein